ncbi:MAG: gas vesicle protein GvpG [Chloroflexota bacterium]
MGILTTLLTLPVSGPVKGVGWLAEQILEQAESELYNEELVRNQLIQLEISLEMDEIDEAEYDEAEAVLLERLKMIEARRSEQGKNG